MYEIAAAIRGRLGAMDGVIERYVLSVASASAESHPRRGHLALSPQIVNCKFGTVQVLA